MIDLFDVAYSAGFFDGEGSIHIGAGPRYALQVSITNTYPPILEWLQERWGGKIYEASNNRSQLTDYPRKCQALWWNGRAAAAVLQEFEPYIKVKREQLRNALAFQAIKDARGSRRVTPPDLVAQLERHLQIARRLSSRANSPGAILEALAHDEADDQLTLLEGGIG